MSTTTSQQAFHIMRGHVAEGVTVRMDNGDTLTLRSVMVGWQLFLQDKPYGDPGGAAHIERLVVMYPEKI